MGAGSEDLLPEEKAFRFSAVMPSPNRIQASWEIADGYYMYRDKIGFELAGNGSITSVQPLPAGTLKQDSLFGEVAVFTENLSIEIQIENTGGSPFSLVAKGQGCNEPVGICYPPMSREISFNETGDASDTIAVTELPFDSIEPMQSPAIDEANLDTAADLRSLLASGFQQQDFLDVDEAFELRFEHIEDSTIRAAFHIADGYYLYRDKINVSNNGENRISSVDLPEGEAKTDAYFGEVYVFNKDFSFDIVLDPTRGDIHDLVVQASYQGCAEDGICYTPVNKSFDISSLIAVAVAEAGAQTDPGDDIVASDTATVATKTGDSGSTKSLSPLLLGAFLAGILLTFTPCVLPMIPILSSVIAGQGKSLTRAKGGILAAAYVLGTVVTYAGMGALAGATGDQLQAYFQNIWAIGILSTLFFIMALSMFGLFDIQVPSYIQTRVLVKTSRMGGSLPLVFLLGLFSALIVGACVSPVLISFLGIAVTRGSPVLGAQLMTAMAIGMGLPLIALGFGAGYFIPRAGKWMVKVKQGFGVMLIAVAIYLLGVLPQVPVLLLWGAYFIILSIYLGATQRTTDNTSNWQRLEKGIGILLLVWGVFLVAGGLSGQRDILRPIPAGLFNSISGNPGAVVENASHPFIRVRSIDELDQQLSLAASRNKLVLIDYYADWCVDCIRMEKTTFTDPDVKAVLNSEFVSLQIDVTDPNDVNNKELKQRFSVFGPPATLFIDRKGKVLDNLSFYGYMEAEAFLKLISKL
jgi:thiol:disulfide interchange protein DsbD